MKRIRGGPALWLALTATILALTALTGLAGCDNNPPEAACLNDGNPWCLGYKPPTIDGGAGQAGAGGGNDHTCLQDPNYGKSCTTSAGTDGVWDCNEDGTGLICKDIHGQGGAGGGNGGSAGNGGSGNSGNSGNAGAGGGGYNCHDDVNNGKPCQLPGGETGHWACNANGTGLVCLSNGGGGSGGGTGGTAGSGGTGGSGNGGTGGNGYNCATDPQLGTVCVAGVGICQRTGIRICNQNSNGLVCSVSAGQPNPVGEICGNGLDDNCNGGIDEQPCTNGGGGGSGGTGGAVDCTTATSENVMAMGSTSLTTLLKGDASASSSNPYQHSLVNGDLLSLAGDGGLSVSTSVGQLNVWQPHDGGGDPMPLMDNLFCRQLGIDPPTPASCNASVIGDHKSASYLSSIRVDWECWRKGGAWCPSTIVGHIPGDLFALMSVVEVGTPLSQTFSGTKWAIVEMPQHCQ